MADGRRPDTLVADSDDDRALRRQTTTAAAMGDALIERLRAAGIEITAHATTTKVSTAP